MGYYPAHWGKEVELVGRSELTLGIGRQADPA